MGTQDSNHSDNDTEGNHNDKIDSNDSKNNNHISYLLCLHRQNAVTSDNFECKTIIVFDIFALYKVAEYTYIVVSLA